VSRRHERQQDGLEVERFEGGQRGVQAKETVEIENLVRRNCDPWTQGV